MHTMITSAAAAAMAASLAFTAGPAFAAFTSTISDLGVNVSSVLHTATAVDSYLASQAPETRRLIMRACETYVRYPSSAQAIETVAFCRIAVGDAKAVSVGGTVTESSTAVSPRPDGKGVSVPRTVTRATTAVAPPPNVSTRTGPSAGPAPVFRLYPNDGDNGHP